MAQSRTLNTLGTVVELTSDEDGERTKHQRLRRQSNVSSGDSGSTYTSRNTGPYDLDPELERVLQKINDPRRTLARHSELQFSETHWQERSQHPQPRQRPQPRQTLAQQNSGLEGKQLVADWNSNYVKYYDYCRKLLDSKMYCCVVCTLKDRVQTPSSS